VVTAGPPAAAAGRVAGELLLQRAPGASAKQVVELLRAEEATPVDEIPGPRLHRIRVAEPALERVRAALARRPELTWVEPNALFDPVALPDDPLLGQAWHLTKLEAPAAWDVSTGNGVVVAILDSGVDGQHPDLAGQLVPGWNFATNDANTSDVYGHGTQVAGAAAAATANGIGVAAVGWNARIMPVRVTGTDGSASAWAISQGLSYAVEHGARVMNLSFAGVGGSASVLSAADYAVANGGVVVAAAGNCGCVDPTADSPALLTVGATDATDALASFSSRGNHVDVSAPGVAIATTTRGGGYGTPSGTSFSSPVGAGVVALMLAANPGLRAADVEAIFAATAVDLGDAGWDAAFGHGRVNARAAVEAARAQPAPLDAKPPSVAIQSPTDGATVAGTVTVAVAAADDVGVVSVELLRDGTRIATASASPWSFVWDTTRESDGLHGLVAVARDAAGRSTTSATAVVSVGNLLGDAQAPSVSITAPAQGTTLGKRVDVVVAASDDVRMGSIEVRVDGTLLGSTSCTGSTCELRVRWNTSGVSAGSHVLTARALDAAGNVADAAPRTVTKPTTTGGGKPRP
jgi:hypothetical protein